MEVVPGETLADVVNARIASGEVAAVAIITAPGEFVRLELERALALLTSEDAPVAVYGGDTFIGPDDMLLRRPLPDLERLRCQYYYVLSSSGRRARSPASVVSEPMSPGGQSCTRSHCAPVVNNS